MKKIINLLGIIAFAAIVCFSMASCETDEDGNPFTGTWTGNITQGEQTMQNVKIVFTGTRWNIEAIGKSGTYTYNSITATLMEGAYAFGTATVLLGKLTFTGNTSGPYAGASGLFSKAGGSQDDNKFIGEWKGSITWGEGDAKAPVDNAKIVFTATEWTLTATGINETKGTYTVGLLGTAALKQQGDKDFGTATVFLGALTIISGTEAGDFKGGSFTAESGSQGGSSTTFAGTWTGSITEKNGSSTISNVSITFNETPTTWSITSSITENGTYTVSGLTATLKNSGGYTFGTATVFMGKLTLNISGGDFSGSKGTFEKSQN